MRNRNDRDDANVETGAAGTTIDNRSVAERQHFNNTLDAAAERADTIAGNADKITDRLEKLHDAGKAQAVKRGP